MVNRDDIASWIDKARSALPADVGQPDYGAAVIVAGDGEHLALIQLGSNAPGWRCPNVAHEQLGPLPPRWVQRTALAPARCGRPTAGGRPCRVYVSAPGQACRHHSPKTTYETW